MNQLRLVNFDIFQAQDDNDEHSTSITFDNSSKEYEDDDIIEGTPGKCDAS